MERQETQKRQHSPEGKNNGGLTVPVFKACYRALIIDTVWCLQENRQMDQWNGIQVSPESKCNTVEQRQPFQQTVMDQRDIHTQKYECKHRPYTLHKN